MPRWIEISIAFVAGGIVVAVVGVLALSWWLSKILDF